MIWNDFNSTKPDLGEYCIFAIDTLVGDITFGFGYRSEGDVYHSTQDQYDHETYNEKHLRAWAYVKDLYDDFEYGHGSSKFRFVVTSIYSPLEGPTTAGFVSIDIDRIYGEVIIAYPERRSLKIRIPDELTKSSLYEIVNRVISNAVCSKDYHGLINIEPVE